MSGRLIHMPGSGVEGITTTPAQWWESDYGITKNGSDRVAQWDDKSGNGRHWVQATDNNKPLWVSNQINGYPVVRGDGNNGVQQMTVTNYLTTQTTAELIAVVKSNVAGGGQNFGYARFGSAAGGVTYPWEDDNIYESWGRTDLIAAPTGADCRAYNIYHVIMDSVTPLYQVKLKGSTLYTSGSAFTKGWTTDNNAFRIFSFEGTFRWRGDWVAGAVFTPRLSSTQSALWRAYFATKYGLT